MNGPEHHSFFDDDTKRLASHHQKAPDENNCPTHNRASTKPRKTELQHHIVGCGIGSISSQRSHLQQRARESIACSANQQGPPPHPPRLLNPALENLRFPNWPMEDDTGRALGMRAQEFWVRLFFPSARCHKHHSVSMSRATQSAPVTVQWEHKGGVHCKLCSLAKGLPQSREPSRACGSITFVVTRAPRGRCVWQHIPLHHAHPTPRLSSTKLDGDQRNRENGHDDKHEKRGRVGGGDGAIWASGTTDKQS